MIAHPADHEPVRMKMSVSLLGELFYPKDHLDDVRLRLIMTSLALNRFRPYPESEEVFRATLMGEAGSGDRRAYESLMSEIRRGVSMFFKFSVLGTGDEHGIPVELTINAGLNANAYSDVMGLATPININRWSDSLAQRFVAWFNLLAGLTQPVYGWGGTEEGLFGLGSGWGKLGPSIISGEPPQIEWLNLYGRTYVEEIGEERLLSAPAWRSEILADGSVVVLLASNPLDVEHVIAARAAEYLGVPTPEFRH